MVATVCLLGTCMARAEYRTKPTAIKKADLQIGIGYSIARPDYSQGTFQGVSGYATYDFTPHFGLELMFHQVNTRKEDQQYERTYEVGPRYVRHFGRFDPYVRPAYGRGVFNFPNGVANLAYNMFTVAGGVDVHVLRHVNARAEYEAQHWFNFPPNGSLSPSVFTVGAAYHF